MISLNGLKRFKVAFLAPAEIYSRTISEKLILWCKSVDLACWNLFRPFSAPKKTVPMLDLLPRRFKCLENLRVPLNDAFDSWSPSDENFDAEMSALNVKQDWTPLFHPCLLNKLKTWTISCALVHYRLGTWSHRKFSWFRTRISRCLGVEPLFSQIVFLRVEK